MELDPKYCDVIVKRWQEFTGKQATLEETGKTFAEMSEVPRAEMVAA
jgi:DNA modification methylase